jgi:hypothetical protein
MLDFFFNPLNVQYCDVFDILAKLGFAGLVVMSLIILYDLLVSRKWNLTSIVLSLAILVNMFIMYFVNRLLHNMCVHAYTEGFVEGMDNTTTTTTPPVTTPPVQTTTPPVQPTYTSTPTPDSNIIQPCGFDTIPNTNLKSAYVALGMYDISNATMSLNNEISRRNDYIKRLEATSSKEVIAFNTDIVNQLQGVVDNITSSNPSIADSMNTVCNMKLKT